MMHNGDLKSPDMMPAHQPSGPLPSDQTLSIGQAMDSVNAASDDEVRTLFVSGLPMDAKPRELYLLFRAYKGYENALLKIMANAHKNNNGYEGSLLKVTNKNGKNTSPVGFVTFSSRVAAEAAKQDLQGVRFDPDLPQTLRLEFAKSNTKVTKPKQMSPQPAAVHPTLIHPITGQDLSAAFFQGAGPEAWAPPHPLAFPEMGQPTLHHTALMQHPALAQLPVRALGDNLAWPVGSALGYEFHPAMMGAPVTATLPHTHSMASTPIMASPVSGMSAINCNGSASSPVPGMGQHSPCSTLFVANLGQFSSEQELKDLFSSFQGFCRLKMYNKNGSPVAFVEYQDVRQAQEALNRLQGFVLLSSDRGGIRIEYAKNKMGEVTTREEMMLQTALAITAS